MAWIQLPMVPLKLFFLVFRQIHVLRKPDRWMEFRYIRKSEWNKGKSRRKLTTVL
jgi:hypothetical protein